MVGSTLTAHPCAQQCGSAAALDLIEPGNVLVVLSQGFEASRRPATKWRASPIPEGGQPW
jgi:hypothetical protein